MLTAAGWRTEGFGDVPAHAVHHAASAVDEVLFSVGAYEQGRVVTDGGRALARAALTAR